MIEVGHAGRSNSLYVADMAAGFFFPWLGLFFYAAIPASYAIGELVRRKRHLTAR